MTARRGSGRAASAQDGGSGCPSGRPDARPASGGGRAAGVGAALAALVAGLARGGAAARLRCAPATRFGLLRRFSAPTHFGALTHFSAPSRFGALARFSPLTRFSAPVAALVLALAAFASAPAAAQTVTLSAGGSGGDRDTAWPGLQVDEGDTVFFRTQLNNVPQGTTGNVVVNSSWSGTAYNTADLRNTAGGNPNVPSSLVISIVTFVSNPHSNIGFRIAADGSTEGDETITATLDSFHQFSVSGFTIGTPSTATVTIRGTDSAPDFGTGSVTDKSYTYGTAITEFQVPAATGGNGGVTYTASGLPAGLVFDADGSGSCPGTEPREICGTPTGGGSGTVTITAADADSNTASSDEDTLTFTVAVAGATLASAPSPLTEANLNGARLTVTLPSGVAFVGGVNPSSFALVTTPAIPGLSISGGGFSTRLRQGVASATLTLATGAGYGFSLPSTLAVRVSAAATTASGALTSAALAVSPTPGVTLSRRSLALQEAPGTNNANRGTYTLVMDSPPTGCNGIRVQASSDNADVTVTAAHTILIGNWSQQKTFTVTAGQDADGAHDAATITHSITLACNAAGYTTSLALPSLSVSVRDDEAPSASISATNPATLTEANLNNATVTVALANGATFGSGVTTASFELVTDIPGVSVDSVSSVSSGDTSAVLTLAFSGNFTGVETLAVTVLNAAHSASEDLTTGARTVTPTPGIALSRTTLTLEEDPAAGGGTNANVGTYTVALTADPTTASGGDCDVWIRVTSNNADVAVDNDSSPQVRNLVFSGSSNPAVSNWNTPQTVTVTASGDGDGADDVATISHSRTAVCGGGFFGRPTLPSVTVNVNDDETPALVIDADPSTPATADAGPLALDELSSSGANSESFTVKLAVPPTANVTVNVYSDDTPVTVDNVNAMGILPLTFTTGNWSTAQTVTLTAAQDADGAHESVTITAEVPAADTTEYAGVSATLTATVNDDEAPAASISATNPAALAEGSLNGATVTVELANATYESGVTTASFELVTDIAGVSVDSVSSVSSGDASATLTLAFSGDFAGIETLAVRVLAAAHSGTADVTTATVNVTASAGVTVSKSSLVLEEAPGTNNANRGTYTIVLEAPFSGCSTVQVQTTSDNPDVTVFPTARTFSSTNPAQGWNRPQTYTVTAAQDTDGIPDTATISHSININCDADGYVTTLAIDDLEVTVNDDEVGVAITPTPAALTESTLHGATVAVALNGTTFAAGAAAAGAGAFELVTTPAIANLSIAQVSGLTDGGTTATLTLAFTGNFRALPTLAVRVPAARHTGSGDLTSNAVTVTADAGVTVSEASLSLNEAPGSTNANRGTYTVVLDKPFSACGSVSVQAMSDNSDVTVSPSLGFSSTNPAQAWNVPRTFTVTAGQDDDGADDAATISHDIFVNCDADGYPITLSIASVSVAVDDDETPGLVFDADPSTPSTDDAEPLNLDELAGSTTNADDYSVRLAAQPTQTVTVAVSSPDTGAVTVGTSSLTFTAMNWDTAQTVTLTAAQDLDGQDESVEIAHAASTATNSEYTGLSATFEAAVDDDETAAIVLSPTSLSVNEQNTATYTVALATLPTESVTVAITGAGSGISIDLASLTFTTGNWNTAQTVTASAIDDTNSANEAVTLTHTATGGDYDTLTADLEVTAQDDDTPSLNVSATTLTVPENDSRTYTIRLNTLPTASVTVTVNGAASGVTVDTDGATTGDQNTLTFTTATWDTNQTVTVSAAEDDNGRDETVSLTHTASGGNYGTITGTALPGVSVTADDNDTPAVLLDADPQTTTVDEVGPLALQELSSGTNTASYTVRLGTEPSAAVTVTITSADAGAVAVGTSALTFTANTWSTAQTVTLTAAQDNDGVHESVVVTHAASTASMSEYTNLSATLTATVQDDDAPGFVFDADPSTPATADAEPLNLDELASSPTNAASYSVRLSAQPTQPVTVSVSSPDPGAVTVGTSTLTFTTTNWNMPQTVMATAQQDLDGQDESVEIAHAANTATTSEYTGVSATFEAAVDDDETPAITLSPTALNVNEQNSATYTVALATQPTGAVTVAITGAGSGISVNPTSLTFTTGNWNTAVTVTASAAGDVDSTNEQVTLTHTASGADYDTLTADLEVTALDNDTPSLNVSVSSLTVPEGSNRTYTVRLNTQPTASVTVTVNGAGSGVTVDTAAQSGDQNALTFTITTWSTAQTVTVTAAEDDNGVNEVVSLSHAASGGNYGSLQASARPSVSVTTNDNDTPAVVIDADPGTPNVDEAGPLALDERAAGTNSDSYTVRLATEPSAAVTVTITSADTTAVTVADTQPGAGVQNTLTFTANTWATAQTVTLTAAQDNDGVNETVVITHAASTAAMSEYTNLAATLTATVTDDEAPGLVLDADPSTPATDDAGPLTLTEGHATTAAKPYTVRLAAQPTQTVTVTLTSADAAAVAIDDTDGDSNNGIQNTLTFSTTTWNTPQPVTARAADDPDATDESVALTHTASTATLSEYTAVAASLTVTVADDDALTAPGSVTVTAQVRALRVGWSAVTGADGYTVQWKAGSEPYAPAREQAATGTSHTVTGLVAGTPYTVRVIPTRTGAHDGPASAEATGTPLAQPLLAIDSPSVTEGHSGTTTLTFTVTVSHASQNQVTVAYADAGTGTATAGAAGASGADYVTLAPGTLTFAPGTTASQTVAVTVAGDTTDEANETVVVTLSSPTNATIGTGTGTGTITDDDAAPTLAIDSPSVTEGDSGTAPLTFTVTLSAVSGQRVTVGYADAGSGTATPGAAGTAGADYVTLAPGTLTFAAGTTSRTLAVAVAGDTTDEADETVVITLSSATNATISTGTATGTITDDDAAPTLAIDSPTAAEGTGTPGGTLTFTVSLSAASGKQVTVAYADAGSGTATSGTDYTALPAGTLTFAAGTTSRTLAVPLTGDARDEANETVAVTLSSPSNATLATATGTGTITDDDTAGVVLAPATATSPATTPLRTTESGGTATFTVTLASEPTGAVVLTLASSNTAEGTVLPAALTFTATDWATAQPVTLTGVDDATATPPNPADGNQNYTVTLTVNAGATLDAEYDALGPPPAAAVTVHAVNADNEYGLDVNPRAGLTTPEAGGTATFTVVLITQPAGDVQVAVTSKDPSEGTPSPAALTFTPTTWHVTQTVTVTGTDDDVHDLDQSYTVVLNPSSRGDRNYDSLANETVAVTTPDDDERPTVTLAVTPPAIAENGEVATVTATLSGKSSQAVTLTVTTPAVPTVYTQRGTTLTIAPEQTTSTGRVTLTAVDNAVHGPDQPVPVSATATGGHGVPAPGNVTLTITDDDTPGLDILPTAMALDEATTTPATHRQPYTVRLETEPTAAVTVTVTNPDPGAVTVAPATLLFTPTNWATAQPVTVTAVVDAGDYRHERVTLTHTAAGAAEYAALPPAQRPRVTVTVTDGDALPVLGANDVTTATYNGLAMTLTRETSDVPAVTVTPPRTVRGDTGIQAIEVTITRPRATPAEVRTAGGAGQAPVLFSLGPEPARTMVEITLTPRGSAIPLTAEQLAAVLAGEGLTVCLPVPPAVQDAAAEVGEAVQFLHFTNGAWRIEEPVRVSSEEICARLTTLSPVAVAFKNLKPAFPATEAARQYLTGTPVRGDTLGRAEGGNPPLRYTLAPALPAGLTYTPPGADAPHGGTITGTPTTPTAPREYTLTATDKNGDAARTTFSIEVKPGIQRRDLGLVLAGVGRTLATDAVEILGSRFGSAPASRLQITLGGQVLRLTEGGRGESDEGRGASGEGRLQGEAAPAAGLSPSSPPPSDSPSPLAGEGRGEGGKSGEGRVESGEWRRQGEPQKAAGPSPWQRATGLALSVARALGIALNLPSPTSSPSPSNSPSTNSPSPLAGEGRGEGALFRGEGEVLRGQPQSPQGAARLPGRSPTALNRGTTIGTLLRLQPVSAKDLLARSAFELPLTRTGDDGVPAWTLWGRGSATGFAGQPEDGFKMDGTLYSGYLGVDYRHASLLMGLAVAHSTGEVSYERTGATEAGADVKLTSVLPYVHWQPSAGLGVWSLLGAGWGEMDLKLAGDSQTRSTRLTSWLGAVGGRQSLTTWQGIDLAAKTDAFLTTVRAAGTAEVPEAQGHAQRVRLLVEGRTAVAFSQVSRLEPRLELGGRWDSGTAEQGLGAELGGGVAYTLTDWGLSIDAQGRYLLVHEDGAFEDWGASVNVRLDPGAAGQGAYLTVTPVWGQASSGVDQLWSPATALSQASGPTRPAAGWRPGSLEVDVGYGLALSDGQFLTPYGGLALAGPGSSRYRLGSRLALSSSLAVTLEGERAEQPGQAPAHGVSVRLGWQW